MLRLVFLRNVSALCVGLLFKSLAFAQVGEFLPSGKAFADFWVATTSVKTTEAYSIKTSVDDMAKAIKIIDGQLSLDPTVATADCSTITYMELLRFASQEQREGRLELTEEQLAAFQIPKEKKEGAEFGQEDGKGVWGRFYANGPGVAMLMAESGMGLSFVDPAFDTKAIGFRSGTPLKGDFVKLFWIEGRDVVGVSERGHMAIFKNYQRDSRGHITGLCFWTANQVRDLNGTSHRCEPKSKVAHLLFSRLTDVKKITSFENLQKTQNPYLRKIRFPDGVNSTFNEAIAQVRAVEEGSVTAEPKELAVLKGEKVRVPAQKK